MAFELIMFYGTLQVFCRTRDLIMAAKTNPLRRKVNRKSGSYWIELPGD